MQGLIELPAYFNVPGQRLISEIKAWIIKHSELTPEYGKWVVCLGPNPKKAFRLMVQDRDFLFFRDFYSQNNEMAKSIVEYFASIGAKDMPETDNDKSNWVFVFYEGK
jgi:hypothetical protein